MTNTIFTHKQLIAQLSDEQRLSLTEKSDTLGLLYLASKLFVLGISGLWIALGLPGWQVAIVLHGLLLIFFFTLLHETVHMTAFKTAKLNHIIGWFCALVIILPPNWFRYYHLAHHRHTHDPAHDPELQGKSEGGRGQYLWTVTGIPVWVFQIKTILRNAAGACDYEYLPKSAARTTRNEALFMIAVYSLLLATSYAFQTTLLLYLWLVPVVMGQPILRLYLMAEHGRCPHVANMLENTRTTYTTRFVRWLAWNMPYHAEHHVYPSVPFHKLSKFHEVAKMYLQVTENGYTQFHKKMLKTVRSTRDMT